MMRHKVFIVILLVIVLNIFPGESSAWWPFKKKEAPVLPLASYDIGSVEYQQDYGDAVRVAGSDYEFVICETCPKPSVLKRELKPVPIVLTLTKPAEPAAFPPTQMVPARQIEHSYASVSTIETLNVKGEGSSGSPASVEQVLKEPKADKQTVCREMSVYFELGSSRVRDEDRRKIKDFAKSLTGKVEVLVNGYTCDIGEKKFNNRLALARAKAVAELLNRHDYAIKVQLVAGKGKCCYVSEDKRLNRRVEIHCAGEK